MVEDALGRGVTRVIGGEVPDGRGYFFAPTVLGAVPDDARLLHEEIFGPVAPITGFASEEEAFARANDTEYGLVAYVYTPELAKGRLRAWSRPCRAVRGSGSGARARADDEVHDALSTTTIRPSR